MCYIFILKFLAVHVNYNFPESIDNEVVRWKKLKKKLNDAETLGTNSASRLVICLDLQLYKTPVNVLPHFQQPGIFYLAQATRTSKVSIQRTLLNINDCFNILRAQDLPLSRNAIYTFLLLLRLWKGGQCFLMIIKKICHVQ